MSQPEPDRTIGVLLMAYGGPNNLNEIPAYLLDVREGREPSPELIAEMTHRYAAIGGRSPILELTRAQARGIERELNAGRAFERLEFCFGTVGDLLIE